MSKRHSKYSKEEELNKEIMRLRRQNKELQQKVRGGKAPAGFNYNKLRNTLAVIFLVLGLVIVPFSVTAVWLNRQVVDTVASVATVAPLSSNPVIQNAVAGFVATEIFKQVDVQKITEEA